MHGIVALPVDQFADMEKGKGSEVWCGLRFAFAHQIGRFMFLGIQYFELSVQGQFIHGPWASDGIGLIDLPTMIANGEFIYDHSDLWRQLHERERLLQAVSEVGRSVGHSAIVWVSNRVNLSRKICLRGREGCDGGFAITFEER
jgi:hypothetical protein